MGKESATFYKWLADRIATKRKSPYAAVVSWLRCRLLFASDPQIYVSEEAAIPCPVAISESLSACKAECQVKLIRHASDRSKWLHQRVWVHAMQGARWNWSTTLQIQMAPLESVSACKAGCQVKLICHASGPNGSSHESTLTIMWQVYMQQQ